jgi:hypothetical protein
MGDSITKFEEMKNEIPTLQQVKEYFKNAKEVRCLEDCQRYLIQDTLIHETEKSFQTITGVILWDGKYAEIISYKDTEVVVEKNEKVKLVDNERPQRYSTREVNGMDVIDLVKHWNLNFNEGNLLKYLLRDKGEDISDLKKIIDYAQREIKHRESLL